MSQRTCSVDGCTKDHVARGYCSRHYQRWARLGTVELPADRMCSVEGCEEKHHGRGYCRRHGERVRRNGSPDLPVRGKSVCSVEECRRNVYGNGLCNRHYQQARKGPAPSASRDLAKLPAPIPCRTCGSQHNGASGLMAFCTRNCYHRWRRADGDFTPVRQCVDCGETFSLLDVGEGGRSTRRNAARCVDCRDAPWGGWCMTVAQIAERDGWRCAIGGEPIDPHEKFPTLGAATVDHIVPRSRGGRDVPDNVQLACWEHNRWKSNRLPSELPALT